MPLSLSTPKKLKESFYDEPDFQLAETDAADARTRFVESEAQFEGSRSTIRRVIWAADVAM